MIIFRVGSAVLKPVICRGVIENVFEGLESTLAVGAGSFGQIFSSGEGSTLKERSCSGEEVSA